MYKNYIFDFYGTLVDIKTDEDKKELWDKMSSLYNSFGMNYTGDVLKEKYLHLCQEYEKKTKGELVEIDLKKVFIDLAYYKNKIGDLDEFAKMMANTFRVLSREFIYPYKHTIPTLKYLKEKGCNIYLLSNAQSVFTLNEIKLSGVYDYFDDIFMSSDYGIKKPNKAFLKQLVDKHHLNIDESVMVGNDLLADCKVASLNNMHSIYLNTFNYSMSKTMSIITENNINDVSVLIDGDIKHLMEDKND